MANEPAPDQKPQTVEPFIPAGQNLAELTLGVVVLGSILSIVLAGANAYLGMFAGMTVSASIPAAVISMAILKVVKGNILQNNLVQTSAASGEGLAAGVIFTLPALLILGKWSEFSYVETTMIAGFGGLLGVLFTIPLRRALIIDQPLQFPEGVATAEVLKVGARGGGGVGIIAIAAVVGAIGKVGSTGLKLYGETAAWAGWAGKSPMYVGTNLSPALIGVGFIVGLNVALVIFAGAVVNRWIAIPLFGEMGDANAIMTDKGMSLGEMLRTANDGAPLSARDSADVIHKYVTRYLGVGGMLVGGFYALFKLRKSLLSGVKAGLDAYKKAKEGGSSAVLRTERDMPMNYVLILIGVSVVPLFFIFNHFVDSVFISAVMAVVMLLAGFLFSAVASYMAGLVGSSNNPVSGITIATILTSALLLLAMGIDTQAGPVAAILIGGVVCCAASIGADNVQDLKCGQLVGSTPWKQQVMQIIGVVVAAAVMAPLLNILHDAFVIGSKKLSAPQANLMASVSYGVFHGGLPKLFIGIGAAIAVAVIILDNIAQAKKWPFRTPVMAFAVGVYLPFDLSTPILLGGLIAWGVNRALGKTGAGTERRELAERQGLLFSAGLITGEALMGLAIAIPVASTQDPNVIAISNGKYEHLMWPGLILVAVSMAMTYRAALKKE